MAVDAADLHGKRLLMLEPSLLAPTPEALQERVVQRVDASLAASPDVGAITGRISPAQRSSVGLDVWDAYLNFSNTLSLTGVSNSELAHTLAERLHADLLVLAQPAYIPCPVCPTGDELWVVGQVVQASTGRLALRLHMREHLSSKDPAVVQGTADSLTDDLVHEMTLHFRLRPHRQRFANLHELAAR
jgi:hypothetical protein